ncbi:MAG: exosortase H-associated membrane protein [Halioglobus sp.]|nr:exosortase H-associated membrane protein [Halioglobus sp.]
MQRSQPDHLRQFLILVFALLLPFFGIWWVASALLGLPAIGFVSTLLTNWMPGVVHSLYADGSETLLMTQFGEQGGRPAPLAGSEYRFGFSVDTRIISYSLPFYSTLHFATQRTNYFNTWVWGVVILYPLMALGLVSLCLKDLMTGLGTRFLEQPGVFVPDANLIAITYQVSVLIVPTLAPVMVWLWQSRDTPLLRELLAGLSALEQR